MASLISWIRDKALCIRPHHRHIVFNHMREVEEKAKAEGKLLIVYNDNVYDVTNYLNSHPGGKKTLIESNCKIVDKIFDKYHYPLGDAPKIMKRYLVGSLRENWYVDEDSKETESSKYTEQDKH